MKTRYWILAAVVLGIAFGSVSARIRLANWQIISDPRELSDEEIGMAASHSDDNGLKAELKLESDAYHFGALDIGKTGHHDFLFKNVGAGELRLTPGPTSCTCTSTLFEGETLPPGGSELIRVEWKAKDHPGEFTQTATVYTNDPHNARVELKVTGRFTARVDSSPREVVFGNVTNGVETQGHFEIYCYEEEPLEILGYEFNDPEHFEAEWSPLEESDLPDDATSGYKVTVTVKQGLPVSVFSDTLRLKTSSTAFSQYDLPVRGAVISQITVFGVGWDREKGAARLNFIPSGRELEHRLMLRVGGPLWNETTIRIDRTEPAWLEAEIGEARAVSDNSANIIPLTIRIPDDAPQCNFMGPDSEGWAKIFLETSDPKSPEIRVLLRFAVGS